MSYWSLMYIVLLPAFHHPRYIAPSLHLLPYQCHSSLPLSTPVLTHCPAHPSSILILIQLQCLLRNQ